MSMNLFYSGLVNNFDQMTATSGALRLPAQTIDGLDAAINGLRQIGTNFQSAQAFANALDYISQFETNPQQIAELAVSALISVLEGVALLVFDAAIELINLLVEALGPL